MQKPAVLAHCTLLYFFIIGCVPFLLNFTTTPPTLLWLLKGCDAGADDVGKNRMAYLSGYFVKFVSTLIFIYQRTHKQPSFIMITLIHMISDDHGHDEQKW